MGAPTGEAARCPTVTAGHVQHPGSVNGRRKKVANTVGDDPVAVTNPGRVPVGDLVVPCSPRHEPLLALLPMAGAMSLRRGRRPS